MLTAGLAADFTHRLTTLFAASFLWFGSGCSKEERAFTLQIYPTIDRMQHLDKDPDVIMEGREKPDFWAALGGQVRNDALSGLDMTPLDCSR